MEAAIKEVAISAEAVVFINLVLIFKPFKYIKYGEVEILKQPTNQLAKAITL